MAMSRHQEAAAASKKKQIEIEGGRSKNKMRSSEPKPPPKVLASRHLSERGQHNNDDSKKVDRARRGEERDDHLKHRQVFEQKPTPNETMEQQRSATPVKVPLTE